MHNPPSLAVVAHLPNGTRIYRIVRAGASGDTYYIVRDPAGAGTRFTSLADAFGAAGVTGPNAYDDNADSD